jgi:L-serine dehydratase
MDISVFDVVGPIMIGPSSSHTAGAARLARAARQIVGRPFIKVSFGLHGSFAKTYKGHGTDRALVAGALGYREDDERLAKSFELAKAQGLLFDFYELDMEGLHENSVKITFALADDSLFSVIGSSIGGAQIIIKDINGFAVDFSAQAPTLIISQYDKKGVISEISTVLANNDINIGIMKLSRQGKGELASCLIETDDPVPDAVVANLRSLKNVLSVQAIDMTDRQGGVNKADV